MGRTVSDHDWQDEYLQLKDFVLFRTFDAWKLRALRFTRFVPDRGATVGDFGAGQGRALLALRRLGYHRLLAVDTENALLPEARNVADFIPGDMTRRIPEIPDAGLDAALLFEVLHHLAGVEEYGGCLTELVRTLKPGGHLFLYEPVDNVLTRAHYVLLRVRALQTVPLVRSMYRILLMEYDELETFFRNKERISPLLGELGMERRLERDFLNHRLWCFRKN